MQGDSVCATHCLVLCKWLFRIFTKPRNKFHIPGKPIGWSQIYRWLERWSTLGRRFGFILSIQILCYYWLLILPNQIELNYWKRNKAYADNWMLTDLRTNAIQKCTLSSLCKRVIFVKQCSLDSYLCRFFRQLHLTLNDNGNI